MLKKIYNEIVQKRTAQAIQTALRGKKDIKLHVACGRKYKEGWLNIDDDKNVKADAVVNILQGIPLPDNTVSYIYNEHFIEHLTYQEGLYFVKECYRVLKFGGVLRIACPDLDLLVDSYVKDYWRTLEWVGLINAQWYPSACYMLNQCMHEDGLHKYIYNYEDISRRLVESGYERDKIQRKKFGESQHKELCNIDTRADSLIIDAVK